MAARYASKNVADLAINCLRPKDGSCCSRDSLSKISHVTGQNWALDQVFPLVSGTLESAVKKTEEKASWVCLKIGYIPNEIAI